jgi:hypothetical protein
VNKLPEHFFVSSSDGGLYDTRVADWSDRPALRPVFERTFFQIYNTAELKATLRAGDRAPLGGYPLYFITSGGGALSFDTVRANLREVLGAIKAPCGSCGWRVIVCNINWEDSELIDSHTGEHIPAAYI